MNEVTFVIALLLSKKLLSEKEAKELVNVATHSSLNNSLPQMLAKVQTALEKANAKPLASVDTIDAKAAFNVGLAEQK
jgi:hypothetical protein